MGLVVSIVTARPEVHRRRGRGEQNAETTDPYLAGVWGLSPRSYPCASKSMTTLALAAMARSLEKPVTPPRSVLRSTMTVPF